MSTKTDKKQNSLDKESFLIAKLALFNVRFLYDIEYNRKKDQSIEKLIEARRKADNLSSPISLMHQATFLQFGYICFVWLWEKVKSEKREDEVINQIKLNKTKYKKISGSRTLESTSDYLRLIRNAISHGRVAFKKKKIIFKDKSPREKEYTSLSMSWSNFGEFSETILFAINDFRFDYNTEKI